VLRGQAAKAHQTACTLATSSKEKARKTPDLACSPRTNVRTQAHQSSKNDKPQTNLLVLYFSMFYSARQSPKSIANLLKWPVALYHKKTREVGSFTGLGID
jgi:hypothetical protein